MGSSSLNRKLHGKFAVTWHVNTQTMVDAVAENSARLYSTSKNFNTEIDIAANVGAASGE